MQTNTKIVIVTGHSGVGKTTFCTMFSDSYKYTNVNTGECIAQFLLKNGYDIGEKDNWGKIVLDNFSEKKVFDIINDRIKSNERYVIDGLRLFSSFLMFKENYADVVTILIKTSEKVRRQRLFSRLIEKGVELEKAKAISLRKDRFQEDYEKFEKYADIIFDNDSGIKSLQNKINALVV